MANKQRTLRLRHALFHLTYSACAAYGYCPREAIAQRDNPTYGDHRNEDGPSRKATIVLPRYVPETSATTEGDELEARHPPPVFGDKGVAVVGGSLGVTSLSYSNSGASQLSVTAEPGFDYFITRAVSMGGAVLLSYADQKGYDYFGPLIETKETGYGFGARLGINIALGQRLSVWPKFGLGLTNYNTKYSVLTSTAPLATTMPDQREFTSHALWINLYVPVLYHPAPHFFFGLGPSILADLSRTGTYSNAAPVENKRTRFGLTLTTGGWI